MARRRAWWIGLGLILVVLLAFGTWRLLREVPALMAKAEDAIREEAWAMGLKVSFRNLRFHPLHLRVSLEDLDVRDAVSDLPLARAELVEVSLSPRRLLSRMSPVSRIRVRKYSLRAGEANRPLWEKISAREKGEEEEALPEILLLDGDVRIGPLGALARWEASVPEARIRPVRFLGTRVTLQVARARGRLSLPGSLDGNIPFDEAETDFFLKGDSVRIRKIRASGPSAKISLSGQVEGDGRDVDLKFSGETDIAGWIAGGAPGGSLLRGVAAGGKAMFSARWDGAIDDPEVSGRIAVRNLLIPGNAPAGAEASFALSDGKVRLESLRGRIWDGELSGAGTYDLRADRGEGSLKLERVAFGKAPWEAWGAGWRPAGMGSASLTLSGGTKKVGGTVSLKLPGGFERPGGEGVKAAKVAIPVSAAASGEFVPGEVLVLRDFRATAGKAEVAGKGSIALNGGGLALAGKILVPRGRAADYGWAYPVSWRAIDGDWDVSGARDNPRVAAELALEGLAARALPPVPLFVKLEGNPAGMVHFVADIPADLTKATATGTITGPLATGPALLEATVVARDIDFSLAEEWGKAVLASLGRDPKPLGKRLAGMSGTGSADLQLSVGRGAYSLSGTLSSPEIRVPGMSAREVSATGNIGESPSGSRWGFRVGGGFGEGTFLAAGKGEGTEAGITATIKDIDLGTAVSIADRNIGSGISGLAALEVKARTGPKGWEIEDLRASVPRLAAGRLVFEGVSVKGSLGERQGELSLVSETPRTEAALDIRRESGWPVSISARAVGVSTEFLIDAIGGTKTPAGGTWDARAEGTVKGADLFSAGGIRPEAFPKLAFSLSASFPAVSGVAFDSLRAEGAKEGDVLGGTVNTQRPDSRLAFSLSLREPYGFRVEGPFTVGPPTGEDAPRTPPAASGTTAPSQGNGKPRFGVDGKVKISGSLLAPKDTRGSLQIRKAHYRNGGIDLAGEEISIQLSSEGIRWLGGDVLTAGNPLRVSGRATWAGDLDVRLDGKVPAKAIRLATDVFDRLDGTIRMELRITGKWDDPTVIGTGQLEDGTFSFRGYAQVFEEMSADAVISREKIIFEHFEGRSGGGYVDGRGELPLRFSEGQKMYFSVDFFDMRYPYPEDLRPVVQGYVELIGPPLDLLVTGDVEIQSARYTKTVRPESALLDFRKRLADVTARRKESDFRIRLDLDAVADGTILVRNNLAEADITGEFKIVGDTSRVILLGSFDVTEGRIDYRGNRYELTRGGLDFQDPRRNNPRLDFRGETRKGSVTVTVGVTGTLEKYEVELFSDPPLSKNDIVSLLSLGVTTERLAGAEGSVSAAEAAAIALGPYKGRVEEGIRDVIGLDKFAIEPAYSQTDKSFEPRFTVGKTFGERLSVSMSTNVGATTESSAVAEFKVLENVYLQGAWQSATTTREGDLGADVKFRYRYRQFRDIFRGAE